MSRKVCNFAPANDEKGQLLSKKDRDLAQLVAHTSGGREVAGSSPVIPTEAKELKTKGFQLLSFFSQVHLILVQVTEIVTDPSLKSSPIYER